MSLHEHFLSLVKEQQKWLLKKKHNVTHSYTVQPVTSAAGRLLNKFLLVLQEKEDEFGRIVEKI